MVKKNRGGGKNVVDIIVRYNGNGRLAVKNIWIDEKREYRIITCIGVVFFFLVSDFLYVIFCRRAGEKRRFIVAGILIVSAFSSLTYYTDFLFTGHDLYFHLLRIISLAESFAEGQIPHRIAFEMINGYGYASPLYYGELFLTLPAVLYNFYVPLQNCYQVFAVAVNFSTCAVSFWCFEKMTKDWKKGLAGASVYTFSAYRLTGLLLRCAAGECVAMIFLPLLAYGFWNLYTKQKEDKIIFRDYLPVILAVTGIINSHVLSCEMTFIFSVLFILVYFRKTFQKNIFVSLVKSAVFSCLLNLWFIVPFLQSLPMKVGMTDSDVVWRLEEHKIYPVQLFGIFYPADGSSGVGIKGEMPLTLGVSILLGILLLLFLFIKKDSWNLAENKEMQLAQVCFCFGITAVFLTTGLCKWDNFFSIDKRLARLAGLIQFPWRYLGIATLCFTFMIVFLFQVIEKYAPSFIYHGVVIIIVSASVFSAGHFIMEYSNIRNEEKIYSADLRTVNIDGSGDYLLLGTAFSQCKNRELLPGEGIQNAEFRYDTKGRYYLACQNTTDVFSYVDVPVFAYDNYHAYQENGEELAIEKGENNRIRIPVPGNFDGAVLLEYKEPVLWRICEVLSCITGVVVIYMCIPDRRKERGKEAIIKWTKK